MSWRAEGVVGGGGYWEFVAYPVTCARHMICGGLVLAIAASGCAAWRRPATPPAGFPRYETIAAVKNLQKELGFGETQNFTTYSEATESYYRCYYTGKLELPDSYNELGMKEGDQSGCELDATQYDVFFYPIEAVASGETPVTPSLAKAPMERLLVVVPHEDFHEQVKQLPPAIAEAAATLVGFLTASQFAENHYGAQSQSYIHLSRDADLFLEKARIVNRYYEKMKELYAAANSGESGREQALAQKESLFAELQQQCQVIQPEPASFNKCLPESNNAGLAFDATYTRYYSLVHELYVAQGRNLRATIETLRRTSAFPSPSEEAILRYFQQAIRQAAQP
ncbi:MAG: aminopeptidase [Acidobacteria bacterium]|nr:aminopeptidase [Acidobacteriota bacterium]